MVKGIWCSKIKMSQNMQEKSWIESLFFYHSTGADCLLFSYLIYAFQGIMTAEFTGKNGSWKSKSWKYWTFIGTTLYWSLYHKQYHNYSSNKSLIFQYMYLWIIHWHASTSYKDNFFRVLSSFLCNTNVICINK